MTKDEELVSELFREGVFINTAEKSSEAFELRHDIAHRVLALIEMKYPQFKEDYEFWFSMTDNLKSFLKADLVIKQVNLLRKIPNELSDTELLFYELDRDAELTVITSFSSKVLEVSPEGKDDCN